MKLEHKFVIVAGLLAVASVPAWSAEIAVLRNGFSIPYQRLETRNDVTRLYLADMPENYVDVSSDQILRFEKEDERPKPTVEAKPPTTTLSEIVSAASKRNGIDPDLISSVIRAESGFNPKAVSPKGAQGLMQIMPETAVRLGIANPLDPVENVEGGTRYLSKLLERYNNDLIRTLAAYNAGPDRVEQFHGVPPFRETQTYIARIISDFNRKKLAASHLRQDRSNRAQRVKNSKSNAPS